MTSSFIADVAAIGPNLDVELTLRDSTGTIIAGDNQADVLGAGFDAQVPAGTFTVTVSGVGVGQPGANPPSGYTDYGSLGRYTLLGYIGGIGDPDTQAPAAPTGLAAVEADGDVTLTWTGNAETDLGGYEIGRSASQTGPFATIDTVGATATSYVDAGVAPGRSYYAIRAFDTSGNMSDDSGIVVADVPEPPVDLSTNAVAETPVAGSVSGTFGATTARGGAAQTITEVDSGGKPRDRYDLAEHRWSIPASHGNQTLTVVASTSGSGDADSGFAVEYSIDGTTWVPFATISNGGTLDTTESIGAPTGTVGVRVIDTDRTRGNTTHNSVAVDFLEIVGDGADVQPPLATATVATLTTSTQSAGRGDQYGVVTVRVSDDLGVPVSGATVTVALSGSFGGTLTGITGANGTATMATNGTARKPSFSACVASIVGGNILPYSRGTESC